MHQGDGGVVPSGTKGGSSSNAWVQPILQLKELIPTDHTIHSPILLLPTLFDPVIPTSSFNYIILVIIIITVVSWVSAHERLIKHNS